jgi:hypothetical protein
MQEENKHDATVSRPHLAKDVMPTLLDRLARNAKSADS